MENKELNKLFYLNSKLSVPQSTGIVNFSSYKKDKENLFKNINYLYNLLTNWNMELAFEFLNFCQKHTFEEIIEALAYLPNEKYLPNILETFAIFFEANLISLGDILENEVLFQSFKRIYSERVLIILHSVIYYIYSIERKILSVKKIAWQLLSKSNRYFEAFFLLDEINKSSMRIKKIHELLMQERYNLNQNINENIDLLNCFLGSNSIYTHIFNAYRNFDNEIEIIKYLKEKFNIEDKIRPITQKILAYKMSENGKNAIHIASLWTSNTNTNEFRKFLIENFSTIINDKDFHKYNYQDIFRDIHFSLLNFYYKNNKDISEIILNLFIGYLFNYTNFLSLNELKKISFYFSFESVLGINKIKYKIEDVIKGIVKTIIFVYKNVEIPSLSKNELIEIFYYMFQGFYSANIEIYSNILIIEKNIEALNNTFNDYIKNDIDNDLSNKIDIYKILLNS